MTHARLRITHARHQRVPVPRIILQREANSSDARLQSPRQNRRTTPNQTRRQKTQFRCPPVMGYHSRPVARLQRTRDGNCDQFRNWSAVFFGVSDVRRRVSRSPAGDGLFSEPAKRLWMTPGRVEAVGAAVGAFRSSIFVKASGWSG